MTCPRLLSQEEARQESEKLLYLKDRDPWERNDHLLDQQH
jgi:hypothetical protein